MARRDLYESGFKAELGYDDRKGVGACDRGPSRARNVGKRETRIATPKASKNVPGGDGTFHVHRLAIWRECRTPETRALLASLLLRRMYRALCHTSTLRARSTNWASTIVPAPRSISASASPGVMADR